MQGYKQQTNSFFENVDSCLFIYILLNNLKINQFITIKDK